VFRLEFPRDRLPLPGAGDAKDKHDLK
jgi:hypothetical protein